MENREIKDFESHPFYLYYYENKFNGKMYIGKGRKLRYKMHVNVARSGGKKYGTQFKHLHRSIAMYGMENFECGIFQYFTNEAEAYEAEKFWIDYLKEQGVILYNTAEGGRGGQTGIKRSEETLKKMSEAMKGKQFPPAARKAAAEALRGKPAHNKGKPAKEEDKAKISIKRMGVPAENRRIFTEQQELEIIKIYTEDKKGTWQIGNLHKCSADTIRNILIRNKIELRPTTKKTRKLKLTEVQEKLICEIFMNECISITNLCKKFDCSQSTIQRTLFKNKIDLKTRRII